MTNKNHNARRIPLFLAVASAGLMGTPAAWSANTLEEVVVTARKASESLQITPVAVTAMGQEAMIEKQVFQVTDLQRTAPSLSIGTGGTGPASIIYASIRGQAQNSPNSVTDAAVGVYIDGVYMGRPIASNMGFLDVGQIEVLRGPQGTLFGRNTTGGALNITTNKPSGEFEGHIKAEAGNYNLQHVEAVVNVPINGDELATRFAYRYNSRDGYVDNPISGTEYQDVDKSYSGRAAIRFAPVDVPVTINFSADHDYYQDNGTPTAVIAYNDDQSAAPGILPPVGTLFALVGLNPRDYELNSSNFDQTYGLTQALLDNNINKPQNFHRASGATLDIAIDFGGATLKSITAYRESESGNQNDLDGSPVDIIAFFSRYTQHQFSQEVQVSWESGDWDFITGAFYFEEGGDEKSDAYQFGVFTQAFGSETAYRKTLSDFGAKSQAAFFQANYDFTDKLRMTAGYRFTKDKREIVRRPLGNYIEQSTIPITCGLNPSELDALGNCRVQEKASFNYPAYLLSLDYQLTDNVFMYAKTSRASMAGGVNTRGVPATANPAFGPETVRDIEFGVKADLWDERLRTNLAVFYMEGEDVQRIVNVYDPVAGGLSQFAANSGDTELSGAEFELTALLWEGFELNASVSLLDGKYKSGTFTEQRIVGGVPVTVDRSGEDLPWAPEFTYSIGATQSFDLSFGEVRAHIDYAYIDDQLIVGHTASPGASAQELADVALADKYATIEGYGLLNARVSLTLADPNIEFAVWGRNLTDEEYATNVFDSWQALGFSLQNQGAPMTFGASVTYSF